MITLEELVKDQKFNGMSDVQVIKTFFDLNNMEVEGMDLIAELSKTKIDKLKRREKAVKEWTSNLPSKYLYETYSLDIADRLHSLELDFISNDNKLSDARLNWAKENVPNITRPKVYFNPLIDWLAEQGIKFKE